MHGATRLTTVAAATITLWCVTLLVATVVVFTPQMPEGVRDTFGFDLDRRRPGSWSEARTYFLANVRLVAALHVAAWVRRRIGSLGPLLDGFVSVALAVNIALVGATLGAYGFGALPWLVHVPSEWAALGVASATYARGRRHLVGVRSLLAPLSTACALLAAAAVVEAFVTPLR